MEGQHLITGTQLQGGKFIIQGTLGQGGFGITYLAKHTLLGKNVAVKEFFLKDYCERDNNSPTVSVPTKENRAQVERFKSKFLKEARLISSLNHPNIIKVTDVFEENGTCYYSMEYIEGVTLANYVKQYGPMNEQNALSIIRCVASALSYLHQRSINHLDVKPANVLMDYQNNRIVLIDFGVSKQYDTQTGDGTTTTPVGVSHGFSPLEQYNVGGVATFSPQSDIYSLGATLYFMMTAQYPPSAIDLSQRGGISVPNTVPTNIAYAIAAAMRPIKQNRPSSVEAWMKMLDGKIEKKDGGKKLVIIFASIATVVLLGLLAFFLLSGGDENRQFIETPTDTIDDDIITEKKEKPFKTKLLSKSQNTSYEDCTSQLTIEYPVSGNEILIQNLREWINEQLGGTYEGDLNNPEALFNYYSKDFFDSDDVCATLTIKQVFSNDVIMTYLNDASTYGGGAHGIEASVGVTFRKKDGKRFTMDMILKSSDLQPEIKKGLKNYFEVSSDEELAECLQLDSSYSVDNLPMPSIDPWITEEGVVFYYHEYEIASYAAGTPYFTVPFSIMKTVLNATGKTFLED